MGPDGNQKALSAASLEALGVHQQADPGQAAASQKKCKQRVLSQQSHHSKMADATQEPAGALRQQESCIPWGPAELATGPSTSGSHCPHSIAQL